MTAMCSCTNRDTVIRFCVERNDGGNPRALTVPTNGALERHIGCPVVEPADSRDDGVSFVEKNILFLLILIALLALTVPAQQF